MHVGERELVFSLLLHNLIVLRAEESVHLLSFAPFAVFVGCHHHRCGKVSSAHFRTEEISVQRVVVYHLLLDIVRHREVGSTLFCVFSRNRNSALHLPFRVQQRVGNGVVLDYESRESGFPLAYGISVRLRSFVSLVGGALPLSAYGEARAVILQLRQHVEGEHVDAHQCNEEYSKFL